MAVEIGGACRRVAGMALACAMALGQAAWAQDKNGSTSGQAAGEYPSRPISMVVAGPPGDVSDIVGRLVAERVGKELGGNVVVENKPGASRMIGIAHAARAEPDGHTVLFTDVSMVLSPLLYPNPGYDPFKDFVPVSEAGSTPIMLVVNAANVPAKSVDEFVALAKERPGHYTYASNGNGTPVHMYGEMLTARAQADLLHVPFQGGAQMITGLLGGQVHAAFITFSSARPHIEAGKLRGLALTGTRRAAAMPDMPTFPEIGYPDFSHAGWLAAFMPAGTPPDIVQRWADAIKVAVADPGVMEKMRAMGVEPVGSSPAGMAQTLKVNHDRWSDWARRFNARVN